MKVGDKVYGRSGVFFPTHSGRGIVLKITTIGFTGDIQVAKVQLENGEEHTVPISSLEEEIDGKDE